VVEEEEKEKDGLTVLCTPDPTQPDVTEMQHRAVCLAQPYPACLSCRHSCFTLTFGQKEERYEQVACPRWKSEKDRLAGEGPDDYAMTEQATCESKPFPFCASCPTQKQLQKYSADKTKPGWFGRWHRLRAKEFEDE
jgi:hypothetical protein